ncbi:unnamed protein product, partial [Brassica napus]
DDLTFTIHWFDLPCWWWLSFTSEGDMVNDSKFRREMRLRMIQANVVVVGDYLCIDQDNVGLGPTIDIHVTSPHGKELYKKTNETHGQFAFTTSETGTYFACLSSHHDQSHYRVNGTAIVSLDWKMGIRTKDWDAGVELELQNLKNVEAFMREINDKTNKRVAQLSFMSLGLSVIVSLFKFGISNASSSRRSL